MSTDERYIINPEPPSPGILRPDDNPFNTWPPTRNFNPPQGMDWFQRGLNQIAGTAANGMPLLRLEWGSTAVWTPYTRSLKYLSHTIVKEQIGWHVDVKGPDGKVAKTLTYPCRREGNLLKADLPDGDQYGLPYPQMVYNQEIGIPRWWIASYIPPELLGSWDEARRRVLGRGNPGKENDMGPMPREGFYFIGWHCIARAVPHICCAAAKRERRHCFHLYREPADIDLEYVRVLVKRNATDAHDWRYAPSEQTMRKAALNLIDSAKEIEKKEREQMRLRIRDAFTTHKQKFTSRKGKSTFIFSTLGEKETKVY